MSSDQATKKISADELAAVIAKVDGKRKSGTPPELRHASGARRIGLDEVAPSESGVVKARGSDPELQVPTLPKAIEPTPVADAAPLAMASMWSSPWIGVALVGAALLVAAILVLR